MKVKSFQFAPMVECLDCGNIGKAKKSNKFSGCLFLFLLIFFIVPGIAYWLYSQGTYKRTCRRCDSERVIPANK